MNQRKKPELLMPASNLEVLQVAIRYGADAVYIGGELYGLRAKAKNFSREDMETGIAYAHERGKKVYVTANITAHNADLAGVRRYFKELKEIRPDALIISDPGVFELQQEICPEIDAHISTQANNVNYGTYRFWQRMGAKRVVSARELSLAEIREIREHIPDDLEIETFVHGAMCISYSGRCLLSNYMTGRDANLGACTHPCRWKYYLVEENRPGEYMPIEENDRGTYLFNSKDLCMIEHIPELFAAGIDSFKVEGRMKTALYVATVARAYRQAIDDYQEEPERYQERLPYYREEVEKCTNRRFTTGFFFGKPKEEAQIYDSSTYVKDYVYLGTIGQVYEKSAQKKAGEKIAVLEQRNKFSVGDIVEIMKPDGRNSSARVVEMTDKNGTPMESCPHPQQEIHVVFEAEAEPEPMDLIRTGAKEAPDGESRQTVVGR